MSITGQRITGQPYPLIIAKNPRIARGRIDLEYNALSPASGVLFEGTTRYELVSSDWLIVGTS